ncbi:hypothetical protein K431DRAFT_230348 [Polychaeton citri CBS 116435]|uniref:Uncharacterized protein n=1 Tax=Polychaeton citri CBS 116435 TaxID=1314669 RepID=A0A9P4UMT8_9PEZI|nr:hypothetical protein K431DRAFT_230348 [Polychaeton citri CBS 116435]
MPAASETRSAGRSSNTSYDASVPSLSNSLAASSTTSGTARPRYIKSLSDGPRAGTSTTNTTSKKAPRLDVKTSSYTSSAPPPPPTRMTANRVKLHRRAGSGSSLPGTPEHSDAASGFTTPFATYEDPLLGDLSASLLPQSSTPKIKPYLRKMSGTNRDDQGQIDLSKPSAENERLAGLGINDLPLSQSASDVTFSRAERRQRHARTTSVSSNISTGSASYKPAQPFVHPLKMTPRPFTPPLAPSPTSSAHDEEGDEEDDVVEDDFKPNGTGMRSRRSVSISNQPTQPTPLSQSHTVEDLEPIPKLTSPSLTNLSIKSNRSGKSSKAKFGRPRRSTNTSFENGTSPSSRTSFDKAFSLVSKRSDTEPLSRDDRIRAARRRFEEKEAGKDRKLEKEVRKRQDSSAQKEAKREERVRRKSEASSRTRPKASSNSSGGKKSSRKDSNLEGDLTGSRPYDEYRPAHEATLPVYGLEAGYSEKIRPTVHESGHAHAHAQSQSGWLRFSTWMQTRMLSCGDTR